MDIPHTFLLKLQTEVVVHSDHENTIPTTLVRKVQATVSDGEVVLAGAVRLYLRARTLRLLDRLKLDGRLLLNLLEQPGSRLPREPLQPLLVLQPTSIRHSSVSSIVSARSGVQPGRKRDVPVQLAQDSARHNDHDRVLDALDVLAKLLDDATVVDEYVRIDYDVEERLVCSRKRILRSTVVKSKRDADVLPAGKLVWRTCISTSLAALYSCSTVLSHGATAMVVHNSS